MKRLLLTTIIILAVAGCGEEPKDDTTHYTQPDFKPTGWGRESTGMVRVRTEKRIVGIFDTYAEARAECDRLNGKQPTICPNCGHEAREGE